MPFWKVGVMAEKDIIMWVLQILSETMGMESHRFFKVGSEIWLGLGEKNGNGAMETCYLTNVQHIA